MSWNGKDLQSFRTQCVAAEHAFLQDLKTIYIKLSDQGQRFRESVITAEFWDQQI